VTPTAPPLAAPVENRLARHGYVAGALGAATIAGVGMAGGVAAAFDPWLALLAGHPIDPRFAHPLAALAACALVMLACEWLRARREGGLPRWAGLADWCGAGGRGARLRMALRFAAECALSYLVGLLILHAVALGYATAGEYGRLGNASYYQPWFGLLDLALRGYTILGLPYILLTRALHASPEADRRGLAYLALKAACRVRPQGQAARALKAAGLFGCGQDPALNAFTFQDGAVLRGVLVKLFFIPLMTVFFADQFFHLSRNFEYLGRLFAGSGGSGGSGGAVSFGARDFYNVSFSILFAVDVGLAWCGYALSTRWIRNGNVSVEPTLLGWTAALLCYPPFQQIVGYYFLIPSEQGFLTLPDPRAVWLFAGLAILSYAIYASATVMFGLRFSNLTHRGIVARGPYALVRHPAYAAKNLAWWTVAMPHVLYQAWAQGSPRPLAQLVGLAALSGLYYLRAITEERHLSADPEYVAYCRKVPYRFIPKLV